MIHESKDKYHVEGVDYDLNDSNFLARLYYNNKEKIENPIWKKEEKGERVRYIHAWERYVPTPVRNNWDTISIEAKALAFLMGEAQAEDEEYD